MTPQFHPPRCLPQRSGSQDPNKYVYMTARAALLAVCQVAVAHASHQRMTGEGRAAVRRNEGRYMLRCGQTLETSQAELRRTRRSPVGG